MKVVVEEGRREGGKVQVGCLWVEEDVRRGVEGEEGRV